jgi:hypothetical protein
MVLAADHVGNPEIDVVDDAREVIRGPSIRAEKRDPAEPDSAFVVVRADFPRGLRVPVGPLALAKRTFVVAHAQPRKILDDRRLRSRHDAVRIVDSEDEDPSALVRKAAVRNRRQRAPEMKRARRARREADFHHGGHRSYETAGLLRSSKTTSRQTPSLRASRSRTPTVRNPQLRWRAMLPSFSGKIAA